jgi:hypothetical protein
MFDDTPARQYRAVSIHTLEGTFEGRLPTSPHVRTLDELNLVSSRFLTLHSPRNRTSSWECGGRMLSVNKSSIIFVRELPPPPAEPVASMDKVARVQVRVRVGSYEIEGFVDVRSGDEVMKRLGRGDQRFVALTSALISGPDEEIMTPFVAVNRDYMTLAEPVVTDDEKAMATATIEA